MGAPAKGEHEMQDGAPNDVEGLGCCVVLHLLALEDEPLLLRGNALLFLEALFDAGHRVIWLDVDWNLFPREGLDFDLHLGEQAH